MTVPSLGTLSRRYETGDPRFHLFGNPDRLGLLVADGSRIHRLDASAGPLLTLASGADAVQGMPSIFDLLGLDDSPVVGTTPPAEVPVRAYSLAIAQKCNLGCTYCYAGGGNFGEAPRSMPAEVAEAAIHRLFDGIAPGESLKIAFLGGEPLANRDGLVRATELAAGLAEERGVSVGFSLTTNGTLLTERDADFLTCHGFAVTVSLDGVGETHDRTRPYKGGRGSFERIRERLGPLLERQDRIDLAARVTVTPRNLNMVEALDGLSEMGFRTVGFSPMLSSPTGRDQMGEEDLAVMLDQMIQCGRLFEASLRAGRPNAFSNMATALRELHRGTHRPYPCGAGAGYLGVSAEGELFACHRFVNEPEARFGDLAGGVDRDRQRDWLATRHVSRQEPCTSCWARYLCGGGCHHEAIHRGRPACDYIRDWLTYCLEAYLRLIDDCRWWFEPGRPAGG